MRLLLLFAFILNAHYLYPQAKKGDWLINGGLTFDFFAANTYPYQHQGISVANFQPQIGYFPINGFVFGFTAQLQSINDRLPTKGILPFARGYFLKGRVRPFLQVDGGRVWTKRISTSHETSLYFRAGAAFFLSENAAIEASLDYSVLNKTQNHQFSYNKKHGFTIGFGMNYYLTRSKAEKDSFILLGQYLKKYNQSVGGNVFIDIPSYLATNLFYEITLRDRLRLKSNLNGYHFDAGGDAQDSPDFLSYFVSSIEGHPYVHIYKNTFFTPGAGLDYHIVSAGKPFHTHTTFSISAKPFFTQFFRKSLLGLGVEVRYFFNNEYWSDSFTDWSGNLFFVSEYFLSPCLGLRGELWGNLFGDMVATRDIDFQNRAGKIHFLMGFHYFFNLK